MSDKTLADIAKDMRHIDIAILSTVTSGGAIAGRPMSNNKDVDYDGDAYFFTDASTEVAAEIEANPQVGLGYQGKHHLYIAVTGQAELIREKASFAEHWNSDLDKWFEAGIDTPGLTLIHVKAKALKYWDGKDHGEVRV